jgi:hypothetical protein
MKEDIKSRFEISDLGEIKYLLGWEIIRDRSFRKLQIGQTKYCQELLERFNMRDCAPVTTPMDAGQQLSLEDCPKSSVDREYMSQIPYRELVGSLMYLMVSSRPDIAHAVGVLSRYIANPGKKHWEAGKRVLKYLQGTKTFKLTYQGPELQFHGYCDADFGGDLDEGKSTSGVIFKIGGGAVSWVSKKQSVVAQFTAEAEYIASNLAAREATWLRQLLTQMGHQVQEPTTIFCDSQGALSYTKEHFITPKARHIKVRYHYVKQQVQEGIVAFVYINTKQQVADGLTKALPAECFKASRAAMGVLP